MNDPARADFQDDQHVQGAERRRDGHEEVAGEHGTGMVAHERAPLLGRPAIVRAPTPADVPPHRPRRHAEAQLKPQFG